MLLVLVVISGAGTLYGALFGRRARARRRLRNAPQQLVDGAVATVTGTVRAQPELLTAPLTGKEAVAFEVRARVYSGSGRSSQRRLEVELVRAEMVPFVLDTKHGPVRVEGDTADLELTPEPLIPRPLAREQELLLEGGYTADRARDSSFDELRVTAGMKVSVHGVVRLEHDPAQKAEVGYREGQPTRVVLFGHPAHPLTIGRPMR